VNTNVLVSAATATGAADTINSLLIRNGSTLTVPSGGTLTVNSGTVLSTGTGPNVIQGRRHQRRRRHPGGHDHRCRGVRFIFAVPTDLTEDRAQRHRRRPAQDRSRDADLRPLTAAGASSTAQHLRRRHVYEGTLQVTNPSATLASQARELLLANNATFRFGGVGAATAQTITLFGSAGHSTDRSFLQTNATTAQITGSGVLTLAGGTLVVGSGGRTSSPTATRAAPTSPAARSCSTPSVPRPTPARAGHAKPPRRANSQRAAQTAAQSPRTCAFAEHDVREHLTIGGTADTSNAGLTFSSDPARSQRHVREQHGRRDRDLQRLDLRQPFKAGAS